MRFRGSKASAVPPPPPPKKNASPPEEGLAVLVLVERELDRLERLDVQNLGSPARIERALRQVAAAGVHHRLSN